MAADSPPQLTDHNTRTGLVFSVRGPIPIQLGTVMTPKGNTKWGRRINMGRERYKARAKQPARLVLPACYIVPLPFRCQILWAHPVRRLTYGRACMHALEKLSQ